MCGVAGIYNYADPHQPIDRDLLVRMTRILAHRGPDGEGFQIDGPIGLGHRRLAIVDPSPAGAQPMATADGSSWISYNGEFYNHAAFRNELVAKGCRFRGTSDTETLLNLLAVNGPDVLAEASGIFAFAFWDSRNARLILARDPLGVKQLYYHDDGRRVVFASEIKALLECEDVPREPDTTAVNEYLHFHTPLFERTFLKSVRQVRAGEYVEVSRHGCRPRRYWTLDGFEPRERTVADEVSGLKDLLRTVVGDQLMADVPVGAFFSGGIDSTAVASYAQRNGHSPLCFGVHFTGQGVIDERPYQEAAAAALGLTLELTTVHQSQFATDFLKLMYYQDQPVIGPALLPMYHVSRLASRRVKVCLGGQAADELFGGYARYALADPMKVARSWFAGREAPAPQGSAAPQSAVGGSLGKQLLDRRNLWRIGRRLVKFEGWSGRYFENFAKVPAHQWAQLCPDVFSRAAARETFDAVIAASPASHPVDKVQHWDMQTYLPGLFQQDDRMSMANSLESRVPLADPRLSRYAFHTSPDLKLRAGTTKWLLRQAVADAIPPLVLNRRKVGFDTPVETWMRGSDAGFVRDLLLSTRARERGLWDPKAVTALLDHPETPHWFDLVWKLASIEAWATISLDRRIPSLEYQPNRRTA